MNILYCGDNDRAPLYIEGALRSLGHEVTHIAPDKNFPVTDYDILILSDYPASQISSKDAELIIANLVKGKRLVMLGGWESFNGFGRNYFDQPIGNLLPVTMRDNDDRVDASQGLIINLLRQIDVSSQPDWDHPPVICGYNDASAKKDAEVLVGMRPILSDGKTISFGEQLPLVIRNNYEAGVVIACLTDLAPHWSGGLTDWGKPVQLANGVQVGDSYIKFVQLLLEA